MTFVTSVDGATAYDCHAIYRVKVNSAIYAQYTMSEHCVGAML